MPATSLRVTLLSVTPNAEALVYANAKQCTSEDDAFNVYTQAVVDKKNNGVPFVRQQDVIRRVMASGHMGIVEPVVFSFGVAGVSRALSHQLVRQRIASFCQQSQRYVKADGFDYVMPPSILKNFEASNLYRNMMELINQAYERLRKNHDIHAEDARFVLPNACETKVVVTMNARSLLHFFEQRCCARAQWEIRALANEMLRLCKEAVPVLFETAGAACERKGFCEEEKCCGRAPRLKDMMEKYKEDAHVPNWSFRIRPRRTVRSVRGVQEVAGRERGVARRPRPRPAPRRRPRVRAAAQVFYCGLSENKGESWAMKIIILALAVLFPVLAHAGQETHYYNSHGQYRGRSTTNSANPSQQSLYDNRGNYLGRAMTKPDGSVKVYDAGGRFMGSTLPSRQQKTK